MKDPEYRAKEIELKIQKEGGKVDYAEANLSESSEEESDDSDEEDNEVNDGE